MSRPLPDLVLFLDECLGTGDVADRLRADGLRVEVLLDHFPAGTPDIVWLADVGKWGWTVLTKDDRIRRRNLERQELERANVAAFVLAAKDLKGAEMADAFAKAYPRMQRMVRNFDQSVRKLSGAG